jgi:peptidoglycan hydrolase-like protein with peptidoglycan-binding domain
MQRYLLIVLAVAFSFYMFGCAKKEQAEEELQAPMSMEAMSGMNAPQTLESKPGQKTMGMQAAPASAKLQPLPPAGPYKPTNKEIQLALKNAGLYMGQIDGVIGPRTKKAIEEFQKANGLKVDGRVGPKTWAILSSHLNPSPAPAVPSKR